MQLNKKALKAALAGAALLASAGVAMAAPGFATTNVNVRSGPGTGYSAVDTLRRGERVDVAGCRGGWCFVEKAGPDGWVSVNYLNAARAANRPVIRFQFDFGAPPRFEAPRHRDRDRDWDRDHRDDRDWDRRDRDRDDRGWDRRDRDGRGRDGRNWDY
jgi:uncharacterized protein YraI